MTWKLTCINDNANWQWIKTRKFNPTDKLNYLQSGNNVYTSDIVSNKPKMYIYALLLLMIGNKCVLPMVYNCAIKRGFVSL